MLCLSGFELYSRWVPLLHIGTTKCRLRSTTEFLKVKFLVERTVACVDVAIKYSPHTVSGTLAWKRSFYFLRSSRDEAKTNRDLGDWDASLPVFKDERRRWRLQAHSPRCPCIHIVCLTKPS